MLTTNSRKIPDDVLASLPPIPTSLVESGHTPILLVTPSFAPWIDPASPFLEQCVNRFLSDAPNTRSPFHAVAAIIDRLPNVRGQSGDALISGHGQASSDSEGISLLFVKAENVQGKAAETRRFKASGNEEPALLFSVNTNAPGRPVHEVGLRLANTIFVNGNENTLFGMQWSFNATSDRFALGQYIDLSNCIVSSTANSVHNAFRFPLYPVSQRRRVISGMGNILRQLAKSTDDQSNDPMPASSELERELPRYIEEHGIIDQRVSVWALVETPEMDVSTEADSLQNRLSRSLRAGGKLHHVMSGGGGWGKKQGLLSLDPETSFSEALNPEDLLTLDRLFEPGAESADFTLGLPPFLSKGFSGDDLSTLSQTAKPGDYVQFFVAVDPSDVQDRCPSIAKPQEGSVSCQFGVVTGVPEVQVIDGQQKDLVVLPNYFGALSEKAITYQQPIMDVRSNEQVFESGTKLNVPGCRVELTLA